MVKLLGCSGRKLKRHLLRASRQHQYSGSNPRAIDVGCGIRDVRFIDEFYQNRISQISYLTSLI
jgi:hypothetical protein